MYTYWHMISESLLKEIFIAVIVAALGGISAFVWDHWLYPAIIEAFVEPTKLSHEYKGRLDFGHGSVDEISVRLSKLGYRIKGSLRFTEGSEQSKEYTIAGRYAQSLLTFTYRAVDPHSTSQGTATFQRLGDGALFKGYFTYYSLQSNSVSAVACDLKKS